jgi:isoleucyl-tRNA synthetase
MPFEKVETSVDFPALERMILEFWEKNGIFEKRKQLNAGKPKWSFLDGPITANNPMGVHHAWGRTYKDVYNRYFAMTGRELRYQNGFDCQGLWVEVEVEKELKLQSKRDIENLVPGNVEASIDAFVQACKDRVNKFARVQTEQSIRLGYWMDWDRTDADWAKRPDDRKSYFTMSEENNYTIWSFLKKCHGKNLIYRGYDVMPWCGRCGVGLSEQEMKEGYKFVEHKAAFVKFPLKGRENENLLVWTTTPWTLTSNVGAAVNPELTYLKVKLKGEVYYVAEAAFKMNRMEADVLKDEGGSALLDEEGEPILPEKGRRRPWLPGVPNLSSIEQHFKSKAGKGETYEIVGEVKGSEMIGWEYTGPFDDLEAQQYPGGFPEEVARIMEKRHALLQEEYHLDPRTMAVQYPVLDPTLKPARELHKIISGGKDVTDTEGTGIVHTAPGCGAIDYQWGNANGLVPVAPIGDDGTFVKGFGTLTGKNAADPATADAVFEELEKKGVLFAKERYVHRYPHCWRCKTELLYRLVDEWFINMGQKDLTPQPPSLQGKGEQSPSPGGGGVGVGYSFRGDIMKVVKNPEVKFLPESISGTKRELDWLRNMGDWMISKKRYWGLALPIWVNDEDPTDYEVIGSYAELKDRAVEGWTEFAGHTPHRPWIDKVKIESRRHPGKRMSRIPDVGNPWLDAGIVGFSTLKYNTDRDYWRMWYPADFITESFPGQFRNWFYALLALSTMMSDGAPPFRTLLGHGNVRDQFGHEMHKSAGNSIEFTAAADKGGDIRDPKGKTIPFNAIGADVMRWLYCRHNPASALNFGPEPANEVRSKVFFKLWNTYALLCNCAIGDQFDPTAPQVPHAERPSIDLWLLAELNKLAKVANSAMQQYDVMTFALAAEKFIEAYLSNWYVRRTKDRFNSKVADLDEAGSKDKLAAYQTLYTTLKTLCQLLAPCIPFVTDRMWQQLRTETDPESVHLCEYPAGDESLIHALSGLCNDMESLFALISLGLAARQKVKIGVRQALAEVIVSAAEPTDRNAVTKFEDLIRDELNVKKVTLLNPGYYVAEKVVKLNKKFAAAKLGSKLKEAEQKLKTVDASALLSELERGSVDFLGVQLNKADFDFDDLPTSDYPTHTVAAGRKMQVAINTTITEELRLEGLARDTIRQVQSERKKANLDLLDKIALSLTTDAAELAKAIRTHQKDIATATQATQWSDAPLAGDGVHTATVKIDGQALAIALRKV